MIKRVAVIGSGTMGAQIALQTALSGRHQVILMDSAPDQLEKARAQIQAILDRRVSQDRLTAADASAAWDRIQMGTDLAASVQGADLVIEAIVENLQAKQDVFKAVDQAAPAKAILTSNSSSIAISRLAPVTNRPDRCCNLHFFHPVTVMDLCEVVKGPRTSDSTIEAVMEFVRRIGRTPVLIRKEAHGFIVNRVVFAALEEALRLLEGGYAEVADIDLAIKKGLNWPMGPFELLDFSGIDIVYGAFVDRELLGEGPPPSPLLKRMIDEGKLGRKSGSGFYEYS